MMFIYNPLKVPQGFTFLDCYVRPTLHYESKPRLNPNQSIPINAIINISPKDFTLGVKANIENNFFNLPIYGLNLALDPKS
jgi:hypothetical protein